MKKPVVKAFAKKVLKLRKKDDANEEEKQKIDDIGTELFQNFSQVNIKAKLEEHRAGIVWSSGFTNPIE